MNPDNAQSDVLLALVTAPANAAPGLAQRCVASGVAACVNLLPAMQSVYRWQGAVETADEQLLIIKTTRTAYPMLEALVLAEHPYELPQIVSVPVGPSSPRYLQWLLDNVSP